MTTHLAEHFRNKRLALGLRLPDGIESVEDASEFARERGKEVCLVLSRRTSVYFRADGSKGLVAEALPGDEPNHPYMVVGGRRCLFRPTE